MKPPRIYTYKITFDEIPDWYWGVHKEKKYGETYLGSPVTNSWKWQFYTPRVTILQEFENSDKGWTEALAIEQRLIKPDLNNPLCLNEGIGMKCSLRIRREVGKKVSSPSYKNGINNPSHAAFGSGGKIGGKKTCNPDNPLGVNNPNHPSYHARNRRNGERELINKGKRVRMTNLITGEVKEYPSIRSAARDLGLLQGNLTNLLNPDHPLKTYKNFIAEKL